VHFLQSNIELLVSNMYASAVPGTTLSPSGMLGTRIVVGTDNASGGKFPSPTVNSSTDILAKSIANTNTNTAFKKYCQYQYQYFSDSTFYSLLHSAMFIFSMVI